MNVFAAHEKVLLVYMTDVHIPSRDVRRYVRMLRQKFGYNDIDLLIIENLAHTFLNLRWHKIGRGITLAKTKFDLMPPHFQDTTPEQFKILDKIFLRIRVKPAPPEE